MSAETSELIRCDVLIAGGGAGGTAAALAAASHGASVCLLEETDWLGGQLTVQGVCTPDENRYVESFGCTRRYAAFRGAIRDYYKANFRLSDAGAAQEWFNPGSCWVSGLSYEPRVGAAVLDGLVQPHIRSGALRVFYRTCVAAVEMGAPDDSFISSVHAKR